MIIFNGRKCWVREDGEVRNEKGRVVNWNVRKPNRNKRGGYLQSRIYGKTVYQHRLLALAFIPNPENKPCVNHIDGNGSNNSIDNLEWNTYSENNQHAHDTRLNGRRKDLEVTHISSGNIYFFTSLKQALSYTGQFRSTANRIIKGKITPKTYNYKYL